ncbi:MAG: type II toxin-antitoxin system VapC family toxin [Leptospiraceae bacterium]|nr:type II toxin-antitoxin system VapC family toxin [Leptospiraceae bacterium]MCP5495666.1 type II toxin-antitoxin system VapC family toxin [Leptospiraceae bacterium]
MDDQYLIDTNILIYYLNDMIPENHVEKVESILRESFNISTITKIELLGWKKIPEEDINRITQFIQPAKIFYIDNQIESKSIELKQNNNLKTPDTIIAATALMYNFTLVTRNEDDFKKIKELKVYNPFS